MDQQAAEYAAAPAGWSQTEAYQHAEQLSEVLRRPARALESSAGLAEEHAQRQERNGRGDAAAEERRAASRARHAAARARLRAEESFKLGFGSKR